MAGSTAGLNFPTMLLADEQGKTLGHFSVTTASGEKRIAAFLASNPLPSESNNCVIRRLLKQFVAILAGNLLYFFLLMPHLPPSGRHIPYRIDLGLLVDLWVCLVLYGIVEWVDRKRRGGSTAEGPRRR